MESYQTLLGTAQEKFREAGVPEPEADAWYLMEECFGISRARYFLHGQELADPEGTERFKKMISLRCRRIPLQYLLGKQEFMGLTFQVNEDVLIPRQDTEVLAELVLRDYSAVRGGLRALDMCTGSGCILLSLQKLGPFERGTGVDRMPQALAVARRNAEALGTEASWIESDMFASVPKEQYDVIVSNPPYISASELPELEPEVRDHEPRTALYAAENGLYFYRILARESSGWLKDGGRIYMEIGCGQGTAVRELFEKAGFAEVTVFPDLAGLDRVVRALWIGEKNV